MDSRQFIDLIAGDIECPRDEVLSLVEGLREVIGSSATEMDTVNITGFGSFEPRKRMERVAVQPSTGTRLLLPPKLLLGFRPSAILKQRIK